MAVEPPEPWPRAPRPSGLFEPQADEPLDLSPAAMNAYRQMLSTLGIPAETLVTFDKLIDAYEALAVENLQLRMSIDHAMGPHCPDCGNAIDPDCCWCGDDEVAHRGSHDHYFVPSGCNCLRADRNWQAIASNLRELNYILRGQLRTSTQEMAAAIHGLP